jgi:hypothetical protein
LQPTTVPGSPWNGEERSPRALVEFSVRRFKKLFADFADHRVYKRQLSRRELPWISRCVPRSWLERTLGRQLVLKAFKPLILSLPQRAAA